MKVLSLSRFLEEYQEAIRRHVIEQFRPRYTTAERRTFAEKLSGLKRRPFAAQVDAIAGVTLALDEQPAAFLVGEMGVGKSLIAAAAAYLMGMKNTLVLCPPHLVHKWQKEITRTLPCCEVIQVRSITGLRESFRSPRAVPRFFILSRERAKLSYRWKPAAISIRRVLPIDDDGKMKLVLYPILACPVCFTEVKDTEGIPLSLEKLAKRKYQCLVCRSPLWEADRSGVRRYAVADFIKRRMKGCFDFLILMKCMSTRPREAPRAWRRQDWPAPQRRSWP